MRFSNGYWMIKQDYVMSYATQCVRANKSDKALQVISACRPVNHRGDVLDGGTLTVTFTAPRKNVIRVKVTHFAGAGSRSPASRPTRKKCCPSSTRARTSFPSPAAI